MAMVIRLIGLINGVDTAFDGQYLVEYDASRDGVEPETGRPMMCHLVTTPDISQAATYRSIGEVLDVWQAVDRRNPLREDGEPNRPFTAFSITTEPAGE